MALTAAGAVVALIVGYYVLRFFSGEVEEKKQRNAFKSLSSNSQQMPIMHGSSLSTSLGQQQQQQQQPQPALPLASVAANPDQQHGFQGQHGYHGPRPVDYGLQEANTSGQYNEDYAPLYSMRSNEYLSQANPELAAWDSTHLLPNAALSRCEDGMITDGPGYDQLAIFNGNNLFDASIASRYFTENTPKSIVSTGDLRALPPIADSGLVMPWNQSSCNVNDVLAGQQHYGSAFCTGY